MANENDRPALAGSGSSLFAALSVGAFVGLFGWAATIALNNWVVNPVLCRSADTAAVCPSAGSISWGIAHVILAIIGLFILVRANVFRPLLVVLAVLVTLWPIGSLLLPLAWWVGLVWEAVLFAFAFALYAWTASAKSFAPALVFIIIFVAAFRLLIAL